MSVTWSWQLQAYISAAWTNISRDVEIKKTPLSFTRGINGSGIDNRVAEPGTLNCSLDNDTSNSAGLLGYYSPEHANFRANFGRDTRVRVKITYSGTDYYKFHGWITDLQPSVGKFKDPHSFLNAVDYMQKLSEQRIDLLEVQQDKRSDEIIQTVLTAMNTAPLNTSLDTDTFTLPFALSSERDETTSALSVIQKVCQTVLGYFFVKGNTTDGETLVFQREASRAVTTSSATLTDTMTEMSVKRDTENIKNRIVGKVHPVRVDEDATTLLYELDNDIYVDGGDTQTFSFRYRDPSNLASRISAIDVVTPLVANTHYRGSQWDGVDYDDANANLTITDTVGGNSSEWEIENTGGFRVFLNLVNIFGKGIYYFNPVDVVKESGAGDKSTNYDFYYLSDTLRARQFLVRLHERSSSDTPEIESIAFLADYDSTLMGYAMTLDIGSRVTISESATGISGQYNINKVTYTIKTDGTLLCEWGLEPSDTNTYFILDSSLLDGAHVLSPY